MGWTRYYEIAMEDGTKVFHSESCREYTDGRLAEIFKVGDEFIHLPDDRTGKYFWLARKYVMYVKVHYTDYDDGVHWPEPLKVKRAPKIATQRRIL